MPSSPKVSMRDVYRPEDGELTLGDEVELPNVGVASKLSIQHELPDQGSDQEEYVPPLDLAPLGEAPGAGPGPGHGGVTVQAQGGIHHI